MVSVQMEREELKIFKSVGRFEFYTRKTSWWTLQTCSSSVSLFSNELLLFANLGHPVDGNSCAGIDQGRYYQLLAKTVQLAKWTDCFMKLALSQIVPFPIQRNNCIESVRLRKETPINSAKMQEFVQPLAMTRADLIWPAAKWNNYFDRLKKSEKWMKAVWIAPLVVSDVNVKEYLLSWLRELI